MHAKRADFRTRGFITQRGKEGLHRPPLSAVFDQEEVIVLRRHRQEAKPIELRDWSDRDAPIGAALRDRGGDGVVRARLIAVARGPCAAKDLIDQNSRAGTGIAVDHQAVLFGKRGLDRLGDATALETRIAGTMHQALHALPAFHQREPWTQKMNVVKTGRRIDEMHWRKIALATLGRGYPAETADRDGARRMSGLGERADDRIERDAMATHDHEIGQRGGADQRDARSRAGIERGSECVDLKKPVGLGKAGD